ncbi:hypothetical protein POVWA1_084250 [Plasmodium ovale wallikeri]|uniref:Uncharacterized protein n=1 Tax=Plasmodium ovale wallikeri TaxID=864142 RepID=A0A1A9ANW7_PLAOA|nr:hypothetical protein POVWA1_084250 [Plasmodium ovale wallikeri]
MILHYLFYYITELGAEGAWAQPAEAGAAPGPRGGVPLPAAAPRVGALLRRLGGRVARRHEQGLGLRQGCAAAPPPHPPRRAQDLPRPAQGRARGRPALLRRPGRRRPSHHVPGPHRRGLRRTRGQPHPRRRPDPRGRTGHRGPTEGPGVRARARRPRRRGHQRHRRLDRRDAGHGGRARTVPRAFMILLKSFCIILIFIILYFFDIIKVILIALF